MRSGSNLSCQLAATVLLVLVPEFVAVDNAASSPGQQGAESAMATSSGKAPAPSDREKAGLRGPVEDCIQASRYGEGNWKMIYENKYAPDGRVLQRGYTNNDGTKGLQSFTYDADGHLLQATWSTQTPGPDTIYNYDSQGRLVAVTGQGDWITTFEYDDQGRKTRVMKSTLKADTVNPRQPSFSIERENVDLFAAPPPGGWVTTSFNERDQPLESQVYGSDGQLTIRLTRSYDDKGLVLESAYVVESSESLLSPATRERLRADPEAFAKIEAEFAEFLGPERVLARESYVYDDQGRVSEKHNDVGPSNNTITKITYNDHGDEAKEIRTTMNPPRAPEEAVANFSYQYDSFGNWTDKIVRSPATATEPSRTWSIYHRTITYY